MTRNVLLVAVLVVSLLGCGKYGPPTRTKTAPKKESTSSAVPADDEEEEPMNPL